MRKLVFFLFLALVALLPHHGAITVFFPEWVRFWKEGILFILFFSVIFCEFKNALYAKKQWDRSEIWALVILVWVFSLVMLAGDRGTAIVAARYLGLGFFVYLLVSRILKYIGDREKKRFFHVVSLTFVWSCVISVFFGVWAKYFGGFEILSQWYSPTISSWVPGQTVPLYHETGAFIRMQGGSSGPTEFAHLLLAALCLVWVGKFKVWTKILFSVVFLFGIFQSFNRAVILVSVLWGLFLVFQKISFSKKTVFGLFVGIFILVGGIFVQNKKLSKNFIQRAGSSEHITRPVEALKWGIKSPFLGNIGKIGPAARAKNLREKNDDKALIAENIFADYFAQIGLVGLFLVVGFWNALLRRLPSEVLPFGISVLLVASIATIFDMTPISIIFFLLFAFFVKLRTISSKLSL